MVRLNTTTHRHAELDRWPPTATLLGNRRKVLQMKEVWRMGNSALRCFEPLEKSSIDASRGGGGRDLSRREISNPLPPLLKFGKGADYTESNLAE